MISILNNLAYQWFDFFAEICLQNTLFLIIVFSIISFGKNFSASFKYNIALFGLFKLICPPFIPFPVIKTQFSHTILPINAATFDFSFSQTVTAVKQDLSFTSFLFIIWATISILFISFVLYRGFTFRRKIQHNTLLETVKLDSRSVNVVSCENIKMPLTVGLLPNQIYVPAEWNSWSHDWKKMVLSHEFAHIKRYDGLVQPFQIFVQAIYFFHPLVWLLNRYLNEFREMACDDMSINGDKKSSLLFSRYLIKIAENLVQSSIGFSSASALIRQKNHLLKRVKYLLKEKNMKSKFKIQKRIVFGVLLIFIALFSLNPGRTEPQKTEDISSGQVTIIIKASDKIVVDGEKASAENLTAKLKESLANNYRDKVVIKIADKSVPVGTLSDVQKSLQQVGLLNVSVLAAEEIESTLTLSAADIDLIKKLPDKNRCLILINSAGELMVDEIPATRIQMKDHVKERLAINPKIVVDITASRQTAIQTYIEVLNEVKEAGATRISMGNQEKRKPTR